MSNSIDHPRSKGLCVNCNDRLICKFHQPGQQILFCEEYTLPIGGDERKPTEQRNVNAPIDFGINF
jgi:hypothetical protein